MEINEYRVVIRDGSGILKAEKTFTRDKRRVLAENSSYMVLDTFSYTTLAKHKSSGYSAIDYEAISVMTGDRVWGNEVTYTLYSFKNKRASSIRKAIEREISKKLGFFMSGVDLSFIKEQP